jgi:hypothetical protein
MDAAQLAPGHESFGEGVANATAERVDHVFFCLSSHFVRLSTWCKLARDGEDPSRLRLAPLTDLSPGPRLAGVPARGGDRNDSNGRTGYEAENGSEWQSLAVFGQRDATRPARNCAAELR